LPNLLPLIDQDYKQAVNDISLYTRLATLTASTLSYSIFYILIPLILKNHATIFRKVFGYGYINKKGTKLPWYKSVCKSLLAFIIPLLGLFMTSIYSVIILVLFPIFINLMYYILSAKDQDILDRIFRMVIVDLKGTLLFESKEAEEEYLKNESLEDYDDEEKEYTDRLSALATLDLKSVEEKIEDEQRLNQNGK
jgi:hypothetical protein